MKRGYTLIAATSIAAASALALTACGSSNDSGSAKAADTSPAAVKLDTGTFRTTAQPPYGKAGTPKSGAVVEGQRMAEYVVHPFEIDPGLTKGAAMSTYVIKDSDALSNILPDPIPQSIAGDQFITGFSTSAGDGDTAGRSTVHAVLRFADPASAQKAANDLYQAAMTTDLNKAGPMAGSDSDLPPNVGTADHISALPNTLVDTRDSNGAFSLDAFTPHGAYVFYDWFQGKSGGAPGTYMDSQKWASESAATAVQKQGPKIDAFPATAPDQLANLPIDADGVLRLTIPPAAHQATVNRNAVYGPNGFLHYSGDPVQDQQLLTDSGTDRVAIGDSTVYRAKDAQGAQALLNGFIAENNQSEHASPAVPGVPGSRCWSMSDANTDQTNCVIVRGRYVAEVGGQYIKPWDTAAPAKPGAPQPGSDVTIAHQKAAAQYEILDGQN